MFEPVCASDVVGTPCGSMILNGAMGADRWKKVGGVDKHCLRFISDLTNLKRYQKKLRGDSGMFPQPPLLSGIFLDDDEQLVFDSEDLQSCCNLLDVTSCWKVMIVFSKMVSGYACWMDSPEEVYVDPMAVSMGWVNSVDLIQIFIRRFVFMMFKAPSDMEMNPTMPMPEADIAVVCMDGFDLVRKIARSTEVRPNSSRHGYMQRYVKACEVFYLLRNVGKAVLRASDGYILGGEVTGDTGWFRQSDGKTSQLVNRSIALLGCDNLSQAAVQHWCGIVCFGAGFRRPSFCILQDMFAFVCKCSGCS